MSYWQDYVRTFRGRVYEMYHKMSSRVRRGDCINPHLYKSKFLPSRKKFKEKAFRSRKLKKLYRNWKRHDFSLSYVPTPDRIDGKVGYTIGNIRFVSFKDNIKSGAKRRGKCKSRRS